MSWQTYVDEHLMCDVGDGQGHHLTSAAIIGHDGSVWAQSANFPQVISLFLSSLIVHDCVLEDSYSYFVKPGYITVKTIICRLCVILLIYSVFCSMLYLAYVKRGI